jgi:hypothetical protein
MQLSPPTGVEERRAREASLAADCHGCGYSRMGLAAGARCPECGEFPSPSIKPLMLELRGAARDRAEQGWLASVTAGMVLLVVSSVAALKVALIMPLGGLALIAVNAPGPKLWAASLLQRSIGEPGAWGVMGTVAVLGNVLAVWLITEPRTQRDGGLFSIRAAARWSCVLGAGALAGVLLGHYPISRSWGWHGLPILLVAVAVIELPANTLLYMYLRQLATRFRLAGGRAATQLGMAAVLLPLTCAIGAGISFVRGEMQDQPVVPWRFAQAAYGALAMATGMLMCAGVLRLLAQAALATTDQSIVSLAGKLARLRASVGRFAAGVSADPARWAAVLGLALWLWNTRPLIVLTAMANHRDALGGDLPLVNFVGPKVWAAALSQAPYSGYIWSHRSVILSTVLAVWLITALRPARVSRRGWIIARWLPTLLVGMAVGLAMTIDRASGQVRTSYWAAALMICVEAPATFILYRYLARLADDATADDPASKLPARLRLIATFATLLILSPLAFFALSAPLRGHHDDVLVRCVAAGYGMVAIAAGVAAWAVVAKLIWTLATWRRRPSTAAQPQ